MTTAAAPGPSASRCAAHPMRRAVDRCPTCDRPRCAADLGSAGCPACAAATRASVARGPSPLERAVRGALAAYPVALSGGVVAAQYVGAELFALLTPLVLGVLVAAAAQAASGGARQAPAVRRVRLVAGTYAVLGVALGFALERSQGVLTSSALLPYAAAVVGVVLWTLPPRRR